MNNNEKIVALFDLDGVIIDTESQYFRFWEIVGNKYYPELPDFALIIKGQTLVQIFNQYFADSEEARAQLNRELNAFEDEMVYDYIPGVHELLVELRSRGVKTGIVTSSDQKKMNRVYAAHPELLTLVDKIFTAEMFPHSKPAPDCYLLGAEYFSVQPADCIVFEDSFNGLQSGMSAGMTVVGLSTTNPPESLVGKCHCVLPDFVGIGYPDLLNIKTSVRTV